MCFNPMKRYTQFFSFFLVLFIQLLFEQSIRYFEQSIRHASDSILIDVNYSVVFLFNITLFFFIRKKIPFYLFQFISVILYITVILPHYYFFNIFSFIKRINYLLISPEKFIIPTLFSLVGVLFLFMIFWIQHKLLNQISRKFYFLPIFVLMLILFELMLSPIQIKKNRFTLSYVGVNFITAIKYDYIKYQKGGREIENYRCEDSLDGVKNDLSPTISYMNNNNGKKDFLVLMESWGEMKNSEDQSKLMKRIESSFFTNKNLSSSFKFIMGKTCFHGNTSSAEGRELLNMNNEESYRAFLNGGINPEYNIVKNKLDNGYHTIAGFSASKRYGSNHSNAEGFRNALNFDSKIYYEDLKDSYETNYENHYKAVHDESLIDSIINESKLYKKVFAYALTINTHASFELDKNNIKNLENYTTSKKDLLDIFDQNEQAFDQFYRISSIIEHVFQKINEDQDLFDRILIVGDHVNPDFNSRSLYNKTLVPYIYLEKR